MPHNTSARILSLADDLVCPLDEGHERRRGREKRVLFEKIRLKDPTGPGTGGSDVNWNLQGMGVT
jgi:hypothetical protein